MSTLRNTVVAPLVLAWFLASAQASDIGTRVRPPSQSAFSVESIRESGERGGLLLTIGDRFTPEYNREMGEAMELWNAHRYEQARDAFQRIRQVHPDSPWAGEAELHEGCFQKFNANFDEAEERYLALLRKYPRESGIWRKVLHYLPHLYFETGRYQAALDALDKFQELPLDWTEKQFVENYRRVFWQAYQHDQAERLCGTKALALVLSAQKHELANRSLGAVYGSYDWARQKAHHTDGYSLQDLATLSGGLPVDLTLEDLKRAATADTPFLVYLKAPAAPQCFAIWERKARAALATATGHFLAIEKVGDTFVDVLDPDGGRGRWPLGQFLYRWSGKGLALTDQAKGTGRIIPSFDAAQLRGGCCGSPPKDPTDDPCANAGVNGPGACSGGCLSCVGSGGEGRHAPIYSFGLTTADLMLLDTPMWYSEAKGPAMAIQLVYHRVATQRMAQYQNVNYLYFGNKWFMNFSSYLTVKPNQEVEIVLPGARIETFSCTNGLYTPTDRWNENTLVSLSGYFRLTFKDSQESFVYNASTGQEQHLERIEDCYGQALMLSYDPVNGRLTQVQDAIGRTFTFTYNAAGFVERIADSFNRACVFGYQDGDLISMTDMGNQTTHIEYDTLHWVTKLTYPNGSEYKIDHQRDGLHPLPDASGYYAEPYRMQITDTLGQKSEYFYHAFDAMGPLTVSDKAGNTWLYGANSPDNPLNRRVYYDLVDPAESDYYFRGNQWEYRQYDSDLNLVERDMALTPSEASIGYSFAWGTYVTNQIRVHYQYDGRHNLTNEILYALDQPVGQWAYQCDARDNLTWTRNPLNQSDTFVYDAHDQLTQLVNALNQTNALSYDSLGNLTEFKDALNHSTHWTYDSNGLNDSVRYADDLLITMGYDTVGRMNSVSNSATGLHLQLAYDDLDRLAQATFPDGTTNSFIYGCCGVQQTTDRLGRNTFYNYDPLGRVDEVVDPLSRVVQFRYNGADQITRIVTRMGPSERSKRFEYEPEHGSSRLKRIVSPLGKTVSYTHTFRGQIETSANNNGTVTRGYDDLQRLHTVTLSDGTCHVVDYADVLGNLHQISRSVPSGENVVHTYDQYDALNRLKQTHGTVSVPGFATVQYRLDYSYDAVGNVTNRLLTGLQGFANVMEANYTHDIMGRLTQLTETASGFLGGAVTAGYQYDSAGRVALKHYGNGDTATNRYDSESRLTEVAIKHGASTLQTFGYEHDATGNLQSITNDGARTAYVYDAAGQLRQEILPGGGVNEWVYDTAGNVIQWPGLTGQGLYNLDDELVGLSANSQTSITVQGQVSPGPNDNKWYNTWAECRGVWARVSQTDGSFSLSGVPLYPGVNTLEVKVTDVSGNSSTQTRSVSKAATSQMTYDDAGNLVTCQSATGNWVYTWDLLNQLVSVTLNGAEVLHNWYDALGHRIAKQEVTGGVTRKWLYVYEGSIIIAVLDGGTGNLVESYTRGLGLAGDVGTLVAARHHTGDRANQVIYLHSNHRGDVILARHGDTTIGTSDYAPFGAQRNVVGTYDSRFKFSSKELDGSANLYYYGFRFYAPNHQRWLNRDPIGEEGGLNLYALLLNEPINHIDSSGLENGYTYQSNGRMSNGSSIENAVANLSAIVDFWNRYIEPTPPAGMQVAAAPSIRSAARNLKNIPGTYKVCLQFGSKVKVYIGKSIDIYRRLKDHVNHHDWSWKDVKCIFVERADNAATRSARELQRLMQETGGQHPRNVDEVLNKILPPK